MNQNNIDSSTILIVDDNPTNLKVLCAAIADSGWVILVATDGESAIEQAEYAQPDLILLDVMMTGINGFETCQQLKNNPATQNIPVIFMTALNDTIDKVKGLSIGAVDYITKPFQTEEVLARVKVHLKIRSLTKQLEDQKIQLADRVADRTIELSEAMQELQQSQLQLVQSEKMSTLGQLVAGVAHEINNPVGFLSGNLSYLQQYVSDLLGHFKLYNKNYPHPVAEIVDNAEDIYLNELLEELPKVITSMNIGIERIQNISTSLRTFSRSDTSAKVAFNIHEGIDSTLLILKHRLKTNNKIPEIEIIKKYSNLPVIECYPGQLNQVFMNIITNAIDALEQYSEECASKNITPPSNTISIHTQINPESSRLLISIKDNGPGIPLEVKKQVFEQFFTTKSVGKGTGLGLSISRQIVEDKHQGKLTCISALGAGTEFVIDIPLK